MLLDKEKQGLSIKKEDNSIVIICSINDEKSKIEDRQNVIDFVNEVTDRIEKEEYILCFLFGEGTMKVKGIYTIKYAKENGLYEIFNNI
jgi:hypothetical protein